MHCSITTPSGTVLEVHWHQTLYNRRLAHGGHVKRARFLVHECITFGCSSWEGVTMIIHLVFGAETIKRVKDTSRYLLSDVRCVDFTVTGVGGVCS